MKASESLQELRHLAANTAFESYDFGPSVMVEDSSGWEYTTPGNEMTRPVFVRFEGDDPDGDSTMVTFSVRFASGSASVELAYAYDDKGQTIGGEMLAGGGNRG